MTFPAPLRSTGARLALALALSLLVHAALMLGPAIELPQTEPPLPPLAAKLEPLPVPKAKQPKPPKRKPRPPQPEPILDSGVAIPAEPAVDAAPGSDADAGADTATAVAESPDAPRPPPLPKHALLVYSAYYGANMKIGEMRHRFDVDGDRRYTLDITASTTGLARLFKSFDGVQHSEGSLTGEGLRPALFRERKKMQDADQAIEARFLWDEKQLQLADGKQVALRAGAQDIASFPYQLSQLPLTNGIVPLDISNGKKLEHYELEVGEEEYVQTDAGRLRTLPLRKRHAPGEDGIEIWLGLEYRLLPVKIRLIDRDGKTSGVMLISEIRVADE